MTMPLNRLRSVRGTLLEAFSHHCMISRGSFCCCPSSPSKCSQDRIWLQTALANGQHKHRCSPVSKVPLQRTQCSSCGQPLFSKLSAVSSFPCIRIQTKTLHLFSVGAFQMRSLRNFVKEPLTKVNIITDKMFLLNHDKGWFYLVNIIHSMFLGPTLWEFMVIYIVADIWSRRFSCSSVLRWLVHLYILIHSCERKGRYELRFFHNFPVTCRSTLHRVVAVGKERYSVSV